MDSHEIDPETWGLIMELQLNDLQAPANTTDTSTDLGSALEVAREELMSAVQTITDEQLAAALDEGDTSDDDGIYNAREALSF